MSKRLAEILVVWTLVVATVMTIAVAACLGLALITELNTYVHAAMWLTAGALLLIVVSKVFEALTGYPRITGSGEQ